MSDQPIDEEYHITPSPISLSEIRGYPVAIEQVALEIDKAREVLNLNNIMIQHLELIEATAISKAQNEKGKPLYSNADAREAALRKNLSNNEEYQTQLIGQRAGTRTKARLEASMARLRQEFQIALIDYERAVLGPRQGVGI